MEFYDDDIEIKHEPLEPDVDENVSRIIIQTIKRHVSPVGI